MLRHQSLRGIVEVEISVSGHNPACCGRGCVFRDVMLTNNFYCVLFSRGLVFAGSDAMRCDGCISAFGGVK